MIIENAEAIGAHESPRTTKLYNRTSDVITLDEDAAGGRGRWLVCGRLGSRTGRFSHDRETGRG